MRLAPLLSYGVWLWIAAILGAPLLVASGSAALVVAGVVIYRAASVVCHQIPERSFQLSVLPVAVCARCLGLYLGAGVAAIGAFRRSRIPALGVLTLAALPTAATWLLERAAIWPATNGIRFVAALPLGFAAAWIVLASLRAGVAENAAHGIH